MTLVWLSGLLRSRAPRLVAAAAGVAVAVFLLGSLGAFLAASKATMTRRAAAGVAVDWQVRPDPEADPAAVLAAVRSAPGVRAALPVTFGRTSGLSAGTTTQTTGPGMVLGLPDGYAAAFPQEIRPLAGASSGVLLARQTAADLHARPGDTVGVGRAGLPTVRLRVDGVIDLPQADSLCQKAGPPPGSPPSAPPDNVLLLPQSRWHQVFDPLARSRPDLVATQVHVARSHRLPADPAAAYIAINAAARDLEAHTASGAVVGNNLGAALDSARQDAAYAQVLFLFLGLPGAVLAALLTAAISGAGAARRRREQALLCARGASYRQVIRLAAVEAAVVGVAGSLIGLGGAALAGALAFGSACFGATTATAAGWTAVAALAGLVIAALTVLLPARRDARTATVAAGRLTVGRVRGPWWFHFGLDLILPAAAGAVFALSGWNGDQLAHAPEGVPAVSVPYWAFAGPALLWAGGGLLVWRISDLLLGRGRRLVGAGLRPIAGGLSDTVASGMSRQRRLLGRSIALLALAVSFAASTAVFDATYRQQAEAGAPVVGPSLTAVDLAGLTRVEPAFALLLSAASGGLVLALGLAERRRTFAIVTALGGTGRQLRAFVFGETAVLLVGGLAGGAAIGSLLSRMLVTVLTGIFDLPPSGLSVPWPYLTAVGACTVAALVLASAVAVRVARRPAVSLLRKL
jgi:putative ABC transport system permease protein